MAGKKLIEVALPLEAINRESAREKSIRQGHPSTLHLWWSRKPTAAARAVLFAQLVDDPSAHPEEFATETVQEIERRRLLDLIERLVVWENTTDEALLAEAHAEILKSTGGNPPAILDPFAGGGSIPLEAQRLGLEAHASDLNPVAVLINKALIEIPPRWAGRSPVYPGAADGQMGVWPRASGLAEDVLRYGSWMSDEARKRLGYQYPKAALPDGSAATVIAWIWARTVTCPNPACGIEMPLVQSWWLGKRRGRESYVVPSVVAGEHGVRKVHFTIEHDPSKAPNSANDGTVTRTGAVCVGCGSDAPFAYVRIEGKAGRMGQLLMAIAAEGGRQRIYLPASAEHVFAAAVPSPDGVPDTDLPAAALGFRVQGYGMRKHADLFTARQLTTLAAFSDLVGEARDRVQEDAVAIGLGPGDAAAYADSVALYLGFAVSKIADMNNNLVTWSSTRDQARNLFTRQAISMSWGFAEVNPFAGAAGDLSVSARGEAKVLKGLVPKKIGVAEQRDAIECTSAGLLVSTDPPYYDNVSYADLSDFFYIWLRRSLGGIHVDETSTLLTPKARELVADPFRHGSPGQAMLFFQDGFTKVFANLRRGALPGFPITVFYAFKQAESDDSGTASTGWQTLLEGMLAAGWEVTATWPVRTERAGRSRDIGSNALASSIVLACRPRLDSAEATNRRQFIVALKRELPLALRRLQQGSVAPVDLAQAAIGPGMAVFSRYARVLEANGAAMTVRTALSLINQVLDEVLADQEGDFDADSRFCVKWFSQFGWNEAASGDADVLARATNTSVEGLVRGGVFRAVAGKAKLIAPDDLSEGWDPATDDRVSDWEVVVRLAHALKTQGVDASAGLMAAAGQRVNLDTAKELAYLLYAVCEKKGWAESALLFNGLGTSWSEVSAAARTSGAPTATSGQGVLDFDEM